jgi:hypothetical protein
MIWDLHIRGFPLGKIAFVQRMAISVAFVRHTLSDFVLRKKKNRN